MKTTIKSILTAILFAYAATTNAQNQHVQKFIKSPGLEYANIGISIKEVETGRTIAEYEGNKNRIPASVTKLVTTATAMEILSDTFKFETKMTYSGEIKDSILYGDIYIIGSGDPSLESDFYPHKHIFEQMKQAIINAGIKKIEGDIIGDGSLYLQRGVPGGWLVEDVGTYYGQTPSALSFNDNLMFVTLAVDDSTKDPYVQSIMPRNTLLKLDNRVKTGNITWWKFHGDSYSWEKILRGRIPAGKKTLAKLEMPDPSLLVADSLSHVLKAAGIDNCGGVSTLWTMDKAVDSTVIYTHESLPLGELIKTTNHSSVNLFAENILLKLATRKEKNATHETAIKVVEHYWDSLKVCSTKIHQVDGSGLSMKNSINPDFLVDMLIYMKKDSKYSSSFVNSLPTCGVSGTVKGFLQGTALKGKVLAKSGSMDRVQNYSGYIIWKNKWYAFCIMVNNFDCPRKELKTNMAAMLVGMMKEIKN